MRSNRRRARFIPKANSGTPVSGRNRAPIANYAGSLHHARAKGCFPQAGSPHRALGERGDISRFPPGGALRSWRSLTRTAMAQSRVNNCPGWATACDSRARSRPGPPAATGRRSPPRNTSFVPFLSKKSVFNNKPDWVGVGYPWRSDGEELPPRAADVRPERPAGLEIPHEISRDMGSRPLLRLLSGRYLLCE